MDFLGPNVRLRRLLPANGIFIGLVLLGFLEGASPASAAEEKSRPDREKIAGVDELRWSFDSDPTGKPPPGWTIHETNPTKGKAVWEVAADPTAPSKPNVFSLVKSGNTGGTFNLAISEKSVFKDLDLSVKLKANTGKEDQGGGLIWRSKDPRNYYICRINPLEANYRLYKVVDGNRLPLASADIKTETGKWHALRVVMRGEEIACFLDGRKLLEARDGDFKDAGRVGLWTKADAASSFDDLMVRHADRVIEAPDPRRHDNPEKKSSPDSGPDKKRPGGVDGKGSGR